MGENVKGLSTHWPLPFTHGNFISSGPNVCAFAEMSPLSNMLRKELKLELFRAQA